MEIELEPFRVGKFIVTPTVIPGDGPIVDLVMTWEPDRPAKLSKKLQREYEAERNRILRVLSSLMAG